MRWTPEEYPDDWERYEPQEREEAMRVANRLLEDEGYDEEQALRVAEDQVLSRDEGAPSEEGVETPHERSIEDETAYEDEPKPQEAEGGPEADQRQSPSQQERSRTGPTPPSESQEGPMAADRDQLDQWPRDRLLEYASEQGLDIAPQDSREEIIDRLSGDR